MFVGHFAIAFGAKKYASHVSLGMLFLACQLADLVWPNLVLLGIESFEIEPGITVLTPLDFTYYPYSHSLLGLVGWSLLLAGLYSLLRRTGKRAAIVIAVVAVSHWFLDFLTHRPDMPINFDQTTLVGLGLWNHPVIAVPLELLLFALGIWIYARHTRPIDKIGTYGLWGLGTFLLITYAANLLGPPPPSVTAVAWSAQALWLVVALAFWIDRHRVSTH
ncbi:MAG: hypothetical protein HOM68_15260 [Gemmatimonadetes bacterium]|jgi:uncharacterized membrane protein|nr:hypothetical protein [Gemmatimonadota bacterium]MBT5057900.1 hypothetical protein [Gemmatimonadota bacterium]MBT5144340.1 hypothetical protein [Gemmatimonadota bacterium]MBT5589995.1 hypothetical protein [Gemmatimonadota bacterium]MBT5960410.1 hypothetical protein [Gemmatimonadota bacterium]